MKIYISADIEGVTGATHWDETEKQHSDYKEFQEQMTVEVVAACEGALNAGATEIWVQDAHDTARNIIAAKLPREVRFVRGWSGHPYMMIQALDDTFDALLLVGYHSQGGRNVNPLAHTITRRLVHIKVNDQFTSELLLKAYAASTLNVPVVFVSGDAGICEQAEALNSHILTVAVKYGVGNSTINIHPHQAVEKIRDSVEAALKKDNSQCNIQLPPHFSIEIRYHRHTDAYRASFFPGAALKAPDTIEFASNDFFDVMRLFLFVA